MRANKGSRVSPADGWILLFAMVGVGLRFLLLGQNSLWADECTSLQAAQLPLGVPSDLSGEYGKPVSILQFLYRFDGHPPLYYAILRGWLLITWSGPAPPPEWLLRLPSAVFGAITVVLACLVARRWLAPRVAVAAAALVAFSQASVWTTQETRMYPLLGMFVMAMVWSGARARVDDWRPGRWLWPVFALLAMYTHYLGLFAVLAFVSWALVLVPGNRRPLWWGLGMVAVGFAPWTPVLAHQIWLGNGPPAVRGLGLWRLFLSVPQAAFDLVCGPSFVLRATMGVPHQVLAVAALILLVASVWTLARQGAPTGALIGLQLLLPPLVLIVVCLVLQRNQFQARHFMWLAPFAALALASATAGRRLGPLLLLVLLACNLTSLGAWFLDPRFQRQPVRQIAEQLRAHGRPDELVLVEEPSTAVPLSYYLPTTPILAVVPQMVDQGVIEQVLKGRQSVWLLQIQAWSSDPDAVLLTWLEQHGRVSESQIVIPSSEPSYDAVLIRFQLAR